MTPSDKPRLTDLGTARSAVDQSVGPECPTSAAAHNAQLTGSALLLRGGATIAEVLAGKDSRIAALRGECGSLLRQRDALRELVARVWSRDFDVSDVDSAFFDKWMSDAEAALAEVRP